MYITGHTRQEAHTMITRRNKIRESQAVTTAQELAHGE